MQTNFYQKKNNSFSTLLSAITSGSTTLSIQVADTGNFPSSASFPITIFYASNNIKTGEIVLVTNVASNVFTITRAQEGTTAQAFDPGIGTVNIWLNDTAGGQQQQDNAINNLEMQNNSINTDTGAVNAYVITPTPAITAYASGQSFYFYPANTNTAASTLNVSGLGTKAIQYGGQAIPANFLLTSVIARVIYDGTQFQLQNTATRVLGYAEITTAFTSTATPTITDVTSIATTVNIPAGGSKVRVTVQPSYIKTTAVAGTTIGLYIREGSTTLQTTLADQPVANYAIPASCVWVETVSAGSHVYKASISQAAAGTMTFGAVGSTGPAFIMVELI